MPVVPLRAAKLDIPGPSLDSGRCTQLLVAVGRSRDKEAFLQLFTHFAPRLKAYIIRRGTDSSTAEDLVQDAMVAVWRKAGSFDPGKAEASTWIFTIARNLAIDLARRGRHPQLDESVLAGIPDDSLSAADVIASGQRSRLVRRAMERLPKEQAEIVRMSFFEDKSHGEIAHHLGLPLGTVKSRVRLAMKRIRGLVGEVQNDY